MMALVPGPGMGWDCVMLIWACCPIPKLTRGAPTTSMPDTFFNRATNSLADCAGTVLEKTLVGKTGPLVGNFWTASICSFHWLIGIRMTLHSSKTEGAGAFGFGSSTAVEVPGNRAKQRHRAKPWNRCAWRKAFKVGVTIEGFNRIT